MSTHLENSAAHLLIGTLWLELWKEYLISHAFMFSRFLVLLEMSQQIQCVGRKHPLALSNEGNALTLSQLRLFNPFLPLLQEMWIPSASRNE